MPHISRRQPGKLNRDFEGHSKPFWEAQSLWELRPFLGIYTICLQRRRGKTQGHRGTKDKPLRALPPHRSTEWAVSSAPRSTDIPLTEGRERLPSLTGRHHSAKLRLAQAVHASSPSSTLPCCSNPLNGKTAVSKQAWQTGACFP